MNRRALENLVILLVGAAVIVFCGTLIIHPHWFSWLKEHPLQDDLLTALVLAFHWWNTYRKRGGLSDGR
jgi:hypothetical protein